MSGFPLGATFAATDGLDAHEEESPESSMVGELPKGSLCCVLAHGRTPGSNRLLLEWDGGLGWVSCRSQDGKKLLHQDWPCDEYLEELSEPLAIPRLDVPSTRTSVWSSRVSQTPSVSSQGSFSSRLSTAASWFLRSK